MADEPHWHRTGQDDGDPATGSAKGTSVTAGWTRMLRLATGWGLVGLGIIGLFVPVLQGILLISLGLLILSRESPALRRLGRRLGRRYPALRHWYHRSQRRRGSAEEGKPKEEEPNDG